MSQTITCARCRHVLRIASEVRGRWVTCPRCLASIPNAGLGVAPGGAAPAAIPTAERSATAEPAPAGECPECGQPVERGWRYCPHCDAVLVHRGPPPEPLDAEVRGDMGLVGGGLTLLALLGGLGMILFYCGGGLGSVHSKSEAQGAAGIGMGVGVVLFGLAVTGMVVGGLSRGEGSRIGSIIIGALALTVLGFAILVTVVLYAFAGCFEPCGGRQRGEVRPPAVLVCWACRCQGSSPAEALRGSILVAEAEALV